MKNKKSIFFIFALCLIFPCICLLTACGENAEPEKQIVDMYIKKDAQTGNNLYFMKTYGLSLGDLMGEVDFVAVYDDGTNKEINNTNFTQEELEEFEKTYSIRYYVSDVGEDGQENWQSWENAERDFMHSPINVGYYKIEISLLQKTAIIQLTIMKAELEEKTVSVVVMQNEETNWRSKLYALQKYKYGQATHKQVYDGQNLCDYGYKAYAVENNNLVSGTYVKEIRALPKTITIEDEDFDNLPEFYQEDFALIGLNVGDNNAKTIYDGIKDLPNKTDAEIRTLEEEFLSYFGNIIANGEDEALAVDTTSLKPGDYYLFTKYQDQNHNERYTKPYTQLKVEKGVFSLKRAVNYVGHDWSEEDAQEIIDHITLGVEYYFNTYTPMFNTKDAQENVVKALTAKYLNDNWTIRTNLDDDFFRNQTTGVNYWIAGGGYTGIAGKFKLVEKDRYGRDLRYDSTDNGVTVKMVYDFDNEYASEYYENDPTEYDVTLVIHKCTDVKNPFAYTDTINFDYDATQKSALDTIYDLTEDVVVLVSPSTTSATNIGNYSMKFKLADVVNYAFEEHDDSNNYGVDNDGVRTFAWSISKINFDSGDFEKVVTYNNEEIEGDINYVSGQKTFRIHLNSQRYDFLKSIDGVNPSIVWSKETINSPSTCEFSLTQDGDDVIVTLTAMDGTSGYVNLNISIAGTNYSNAYVSEYYFQVIINKARYTEQQQLAILGAIGAEEIVNEYNNTEYKLDAGHKIIISRATMILPNVLPDYTDNVNPPATAELGTWKLYYNDTEKFNGDVLQNESPTGWRFEFIPNDDMFIGYTVYVDWQTDIEFVNEDIPADVLSALKNEFASYFGEEVKDGFTSDATITKIYTDGNGYGSHEAFMPVHDNNEEGAFEGEWLLCFDGDGYDISLRNGASYSYAGLTEEYIKSSERNWRIKFVPANGGYNTIEIQVNVVFE